MSVFSALLNNGPLQVGPLADRGAFDQYATYRPGNVVVDGGVVYLNIAAVGAAPELEDTFQRQDQNGWGQSSHGEVWQTSSALAHDLPARIQAGLGTLQIGPAGELTDGQLWGPARLRADCELLARLQLPVPGADVNYVSVGLNATEDNTSFAQFNVDVSADGTTALNVTGELAGVGETVPSPAAGPTLSDAQTVWARLRRVGLVYTGKLWAAGTPEPSSPQATNTFSDAQPAGHPFVQMGGGADGAVTGVAYLSVRPVTAAAAPGDDTDHWVALADALQVPYPY